MPRLPHRPKTGYKWLHRAATSHAPAPLADRYRRPHHCPARTPAAVAHTIVQVHDDYGWGARKVRAFLLQRGYPMPALGTVHAVLRRHQRVRAVPPPAPPGPPLRFQRAAPNHLWQMDFKGPLPTPRRRWLLTIVDDHSRYLLAVHLGADQTMATAWSVLWAVFGTAGLPRAILSDNGFAPRGPAMGGLSWLEARLRRLEVDAIHGRPYHPQTQGKVERLNRTLDEEVLSRLDWDRPDAELAEQLERWRVEVYNALRPHEALGQQTPASRWQASSRSRPGRLPELSYPVGMATRKVMQRGEISWQGYELLVGAGLTGERVGVQECGTEVVLLYGTYELRRVLREQLVKGRIV